VTPEQLSYTKTHEWVSIQEDAGVKVATVGLSAFAIETLTNLVFIELPEVGRQVNAGESCGEVESIKAVSDFYSPVTGEVIETNSKLPDDLEVLNQDPYGEGWIVKIKLTDETGLDNLLNHTEYQQQCKEEEH